MVVRKFPNRAGHRMVDEDVSFCGIENGIEIGLLVLPESQRADAVLDKDEVQPGDNDITGTGIAIRLVSEYFFG